jgi:hypothetical protein
MSGWDSYLDAARRLDRVRREAAALATAEATAVHAARHELAGIRRHVDRQRARLRVVAQQAGLPAPIVTPVHAVPDPGDVPAITDALRAATAALIAADDVLGRVEHSHRRRGRVAAWPAGQRNALLYGGFAATVVLIQILVLTFGAATGSVATLLSAALPLLGFGAAWAAVGLIFRGSGRVNRTPVLGAAINAAPVILLYAMVGWLGMG